jgi:chromosomal replication initiation ATPase DnaA
VARFIHFWRLQGTPNIWYLSTLQRHKVKQEDLFYSRRGQYNEARNVAIYLARKVRGERLKEIGEAFGIGRYSTVSSAVQRTKTGMGRDELFRKKAHNLISIITKSQKWT